MLVDVGARRGLMRDEAVPFLLTIPLSQAKSCCQHPRQLAISSFIFSSFMDDFSIQGRGNDSMSAKYRYSLMAQMLVMLPS